MEPLWRKQDRQMFPYDFVFSVTKENFRAPVPRLDSIIQVRANDYIRGIFNQVFNVRFALRSFFKKESVFQRHAELRTKGLKEINFLHGELVKPPASYR